MFKNKMEKTAVMNRNETMTVQETAKLLGMRPQSLRIAIDNGEISWAQSINLKRKRYLIYRKRFETETGINTNQTMEETK